MPRASVIIPNWNGRHHLDVCLGALRAQDFTDFETILVDNASTDGSVAHVAAHFPEVRILTMPTNQGFTGAGNAGYAVANGDYILLLNNDTEATAGWVGAVVDAFDRLPDVGVVASKILLYDRRDHFHTAGDLYRRDGTPGNRGVWERDVGQYNKEEDVFGACGGAAGYRRAMVAEIGFLDELFFFSCEDVDLAWRAHLAGWRVRYVPTAVVYHKLKASGGSGALSSYYDGRNTLYTLWKNYPSSLLRRNAGAILRGQWRISREALRAWRGGAARATLRGQLAGVLGVVRMWPRRRAIQRARRASDAAVARLLAAVDEPPAHR